MKNCLKYALTSIALIQIFGCTRANIQKKRYVELDWSAPTEKEVVLDVFATNQISGNLNSNNTKFSDNSDSPINTGGASLLLAYRDISRLRPEANTLWLDTGGAFDSLAGIVHHKNTAHFLKSMNYDAVAFTEKELATVGTSPNFLTAPFIISNMIDLNNAQLFENEAVKSWRIIEKANMRIGVVAVTNYKSIKNDSPDKTRGLYFEDMVLGVLRAKKEFSRRNVNFTILLANIDSACHSNAKNNDEIICPDEGDDLKRLLSRIPPNTINLTIATPSRIAAGVINNIPVIMVPGQGKWLGRARVHFDKDSLAFDIDNIELLPPIRVCDQIYHSTNDCYIPAQGENDEEHRSEFLKESVQELKPAKFWGHEIIKNSKIENEFHLIRTQGNLDHSSSEP